MQNSAVIQDLAPHGRIRIALNLGNPSVVTRDGASDSPRGIAVDLSRKLAEECGMPLEFVFFNSAGMLIDAGSRDAWDVAFLAIDEKRREHLSFTGSYMQIHGRYMVRTESPIQHPEQLDTPGRCVAVTAGSAYDSFLSKTLKNARLERHATSTGSFNVLMQSGVDAAAGVTLALRNFASGNPGARILDEPFMVIDQALAISKRCSAGADYLSNFIARQVSTRVVRG